MNIKFHKHILKFFFCAAVLTALTACSSGSGGGGGNNPPAPEKACDETTHNCSTGEPLASCDPLLTNCDPVPPDVVAPEPCAPDCDPGEEDSATAYLPTVFETPPSGGWVAALTAVRTAEYHATRTPDPDADPTKYSAADQIGAAYAYARGHNGAGITISNMGPGRLAQLHPDLSGQWIAGLNSDSFNPDDPRGGTCEGESCNSYKNVNHAIGIIVAKKGNGDTTIQGIAYGAKIKPIEVSGFASSFTSAQRATAIRQASGSNITVMNNNNWTTTNPATFDDMGMTYHYNLPVRFTEMVGRLSLGTASAPMADRTAWKNAVKTTVLVFPQGDYGQNSVNGMVQLYNRDNPNNPIRLMEAGAPKDLAWSIIDADDGVRNLGTYTDLPNLVPDVQGKMLTVIALKDDNEIWEYSNGCGDAENYCLGAPGVDINSTIPGTTTHETQSGTAQAAAYVSAAVAVVANSLPAVEDTDEARAQRVKDLVAIILQTADYIPIDDDDDGENGDTNEVYGYGSLNLARATDPVGNTMIISPSGTALAAGITMDNSGITLPTSFGGALDGFTVGFTDDYNRAFIGKPTRITRASAAFTLGDTLATWDSPELQSIALDSNSKMQFTNYDGHEDAKDTLIFTHKNANHLVSFSYNEESKTPDLSLAGAGEELHFQKIRPIASDLMQVNSTHKLGKAWNVKNALTSGEFDTGNRFNEAMANLNYASENRNLTIGAGTLKEYGQFLGASGTGAYQLSDATQSQVTHLAISQNLPLNSAIKVKYTGFKTEVDMRYSNFANINDLTADEYQLSFAKKQVWGKNDSLNIELIQPFAVTDGTLQQNTVLGYNEAGGYNNVTQNYDLTPANRRQQLRMTWQNQLGLERKTKLFISMQYDNHVDNLRDKEDSQILGGISTRF